MLNKSIVRIVTAVSIVAGLAAAALTFLPWVDLREFGTNLYWTGLGTYRGDSPDHLGRLLAEAGVMGSLGWVVLVSTVLACVALVAAGRLPLLRMLAVGFAAVAFLTVLTCLARPSLMIGGLKTELGIEAMGDRELVNTAVLYAELAVTAVLLLGTVLIAGARRTPPEAPHNDRPESHPAPPDGG